MQSLQENKVLKIDDDLRTSYQTSGIDIDKVMQNGFCVMGTSLYTDNFFMPAVAKPKHFSEREIDRILAHEKLYDKLSYVDRYYFMQSLAKSISRELDIETPEIYLNANPYDQNWEGGREIDGPIKMRIDGLDSLGELVEHLAHELRHEWQKDKEYTYADGSTISYDDAGDCSKSYYNAIFSYKPKNRPKRPFKLGYLTSPNEVDARNYAIEYAMRKGAPILSWSKRETTTIKEACQQFLTEKTILRVERSNKFLSEFLPEGNPDYEIVRKNAKEYLATRQGSAKTPRRIFSFKKVTKMPNIDYLANELCCMNPHIKIELNTCNRFMPELVVDGDMRELKLPKGFALSDGGIGGCISNKDSTKSGFFLSLAVRQTRISIPRTRRTLFGTHNGKNTSIRNERPL